MSFLRRLIGGRPAAERSAEPGTAGTDGTAASTPDEKAAGTPDGTAAGTGDSEMDEAARERDLLRAEAERLDDDLLQRQLRYANRSWTPPAQGGPRRADDEDAEPGG